MTSYDLCGMQLFLVVKLFIKILRFFPGKPCTRCSNMTRRLVYSIYSDIFLLVLVFLVALSAKIRSQVGLVVGLPDLALSDCRKV